MEHVIRTARGAIGKDEQGLRREFVGLGEMARELMGPSVSRGPEVYVR
jgi:hypothetical protein